MMEKADSMVIESAPVILALGLLVLCAAIIIGVLYLRLLRILAEKKQAEDVEKKLNRALRLLSACNMTLVRAKEEHKLLEAICALIVESGGYRMAWVGYAEDSEEKLVRPISQSGFEHGYLVNARISWANVERGRGPTGTAIRSGKTQINQDVLHNPVMVPWRESAVKLGYNASIALPLMEGDAVFGALTIYSTDPGAFFPEEVKLLEELACDLAFGIVTIRQRQKQEQAEERVVFLRFHDPLTKLPNRLLTRDRFDQAVLMAEHNHKHIAVFYLDIDHFSVVNDSLGSKLADELLIFVVSRLQECVWDGDTISRYGDDEFLILLPTISGVNQASSIADGILAAFAEPFDLGGTLVTVSFSIGISLCPDDGHDFDGLLKCADAAVREAKESGRNTYRFFTETMNVSASKNNYLRHQIPQGLKNGEFILHYQPQIDLKSGDVIGAEALIRWNHPQLGLVPPGQFIPVAEDSGAIIPVGEWVMREACRQLAGWQQVGLSGLVMAVNLSALQFKRGNLESMVVRALENAGLASNCLELELTESILIKDVDAVLALVGRFKELGLKLSIDDFGTGYSSLAYLKRFRVDKLKIDQSFVRDLTSDPEDASIVHAIIQMAKSLNLKTIAEGVEDERTLNHLQSLRCDEVQGYYFARPLPADAFVDFVMQRREQIQQPAVTAVLT